MSSVAVYRFDIDRMPGDVSRPIRTTHGAVMRHTPDAAGDDKRYVSQGPTGVKKFKRAFLHGLDTESTPAPAPELTRQEVLHLHMLLAILL